MATSANYALEILTTATDAPEEWFQRITEILDRALGEFLQKVGVGGVISGWTLNTSAEVAAGEGIVNGCHCITAAATDVSALLTVSATNYIYAVVDATSPEDGTVDFGAVTAVGSIPAGAVRLGSMVVDGAGAVTAADDNPTACLRDLMPPLRRRRTPWATQAVTCAIGASAVVEIDHSATVTFLYPGLVEVDAPDDVSVTMLADGRTGGLFRLLVQNDSASADPSIDWRVEGLL